MQRKLGQKGLEVSALGLGCMGMSAFYGQTNKIESMQVLNRAFDSGITFSIQREYYGPFTLS